MNDVERSRALEARAPQLPAEKPEAGKPEIFVPSAGGLSHHPDEYTAPDEIDRGVAVLAGTLARLAA